MKAIISSLAFFALFISFSYGQYCGHFGNPSNPSQCTPTATTTHPELFPISDSIPPLVNGEISNTVIQFKNLDTIRFGGQLLTIQSIRFDSIGNLPSGLCWATNSPNNAFNNSSTGCIKIVGTTCTVPGQYKVLVRVDVNVGGFIGGEPGEGLKLFLRVKNVGDADIPVDTTQTSANPFIPYGNAANCIIGIKDEETAINHLSITPNPFSDKAMVSFFSAKACIMMQRVTNLLGNEISEKEVTVKAGDNSLQLEKANLAAGVYFYSLTDGRNAVTKRLVIAE